jgi:hypothetical protein
MEAKGKCSKPLDTAAALRPIKASTLIIWEKATAASAPT